MAPPTPPKEALAELLENVQLTTFNVPRSKMAPPPLAELEVKVVFDHIHSGLKLDIPGPADFVETEQLPVIVLSLTLAPVTVSAFLMPPPWEAELPTTVQLLTVSVPVF